MNIAIVVVNLAARPGRDRADGADALVQAAARVRSRAEQDDSRPWLGAVRVRLPARDGARASRASSPTRSTRASASARSCRIPFGRSRARGIVVALGDAPPPGVDARPIEAVLGADPAGARRARALARRLLRLDAGARARARRARGAEAAQGAGAAGRAAVARRARPSRTTLSAPQVAAVARIVEAMDAGGGNFLLYGATGSGKTEVYLQACAAVLERGLGAIVLVPEIALAPQTVGRVRARFGDRVAILHSALTDAERRDERERIASGEARIVVGARSAIFAPVRGLGLIVVDEEHDPSYKQDSDPRYDARTVAAKRAALEGAVAVYGSATPRPESWAALERLELGGRIGAELPPVRVIDLRREAGYPLSAPLLDAAARRRRAARQGDPAPEPPRRRAGAPLPRVRHDDPLPELRRRARPARRRVAALPPLRLHEPIAVETARRAARRISRGSARARRSSSASSRASCPSSS